MNIALVQMNSVIGGFEKNRRKIVDFTQQAKKNGAELILFPELSVCGYPPMDLLDQQSFVKLNMSCVQQLQWELPPDIAAGIGFVSRSPYRHGKLLVNEYGIISGGQLVFEQIKTLLPTYDVFDEARNFEPAQERATFEFHSLKIGIAVCEDVWRETGIPGTLYQSDPVSDLLQCGADLLCIPSASPFVAGKHTQRLQIARSIVDKGNIPVAYINAVGANDQIIFDGRSFFIGVKTTLDADTAEAFEETILYETI